MEKRKTRHAAVAMIVCTLLVCAAVFFLHHVINVWFVLGAAWAVMGFVGACASKYVAPRMAWSDHILWFVMWPYFLGYIVADALGHGASWGSSGSSTGTFDFDVDIDFD